MVSRNLGLNKILNPYSEKQNDDVEHKLLILSLRI